MKLDLSTEELNTIVICVQRDISYILKNLPDIDNNKPAQDKIAKLEAVANKLAIARDLSSDGMIGSAHG
jgi:hypothetical protein